MKKYDKPHTALHVAACAFAAALIVMLAGCQAYQPQNSSSGTAPQTETSSAPSEATEPTVIWTPAEVTIDPGELLQTMPAETLPAETAPADPAQAQVIRIQDISQSALEALMARHPGSVLVSDALPLIQLTGLEELEAFLQETGSEILQEACGIYDSTFFQENDLLMVPRLTTTGSARHTVELRAQDGILAAEITVTVPEIATMDMAHWMLAIPVSKSDTQGKTCVAYLTGGLQGPGSGSILPTVPTVRE